MSDPLSDPRAQRLLAADAGEVGALGTAFRHVADQASSAAGALRGARADATWTGAAADAFRAQVGKLPGDLDKVARSYSEVADALDRYEPTLGSLQSQFRGMASALTNARGNLSSAQGQLAGAQTTLSHATSAPNAKPNSPAVLDAHSAVTQLSGAVGRAQGEVSALEGQGMRLLDEFDHARGQARSAVSGAAGIAPSQSWLSGALADVGSFFSGVGDVFVGIGKGLYDMGKGVVDAAERLPGDVEYLTHHFDDLHAWSKFLGDAGTVLAAAAFVAAVVAFPFSLAGVEGIAGAAELAETYVDGAGIVATAGKTAADAGLLAEGKGNAGSLVSDVIGLAGARFNPGEQAARDESLLLSTKSSGLEQFGLQRALGATPQEAYSTLSADQRFVVTKSLNKLADPGRLSYMRETASSAAEAASAHLANVKFANSAGHFALDKAREAVFPEPAEPCAPQG